MQPWLKLLQIQLSISLRLTVCFKKEELFLWQSVTKSLWYKRYNIYRTVILILMLLHNKNKNIYSRLLNIFSLQCYYFTYQEKWSSFLIMSHKSVQNNIPDSFKSITTHNIKLAWLRLTLHLYLIMNSEIIPQCWQIQMQPAIHRC